jgi:hypothetical protein
MLPIKISKIFYAVLLVGVLALTGCSSSGSAPTTTVAGTASKGIVYPGSVSIYSLNADTGDKNTPALKTVATDVNGKFSADLGDYAGSIVIEVIGTYTDEASGISVIIDSSRPMKAIIADVSPTAPARRYAVTPLTDLAATLMKSALPVTSAGIISANARVSEQFKISDITTVEPVALAAMSASATTDEQRAYSLALATIAKMAGSGLSFNQVATLLTQLSNDLSASPTAVLSQSSRDAFTTALAELVKPATSTITAGPFANFASVAGALNNIGSRTLKLTLAAGATTASNAAISGKITLPAGTSLRTDGNGYLIASVFSASTAGTSMAPVGRLSGGTVDFSLVIANGLAAGSLATLTVDVVSGNPQAADFILSNISATTNSGNNTVALSLPLSLQ